MIKRISMKKESLIGATTGNLRQVAAAVAILR